MEVVIPSRNSLTIPLTLLSLSDSNLVGTKIGPITIKILDNGEVPITNSVVVRQIIDLLTRMKGIEVIIKREKFTNMMEVRRNLLEWAQGKEVLMMDDDIILKSRCLSLLNQTFSKKPVGGVIPTIMDVNNLRQYPDYSEEVLKEIPNLNYECTKQFRFYNFDSVIPVEYTSTGCILLDRVKALDAIKGKSWGNLPGEDVVFTQKLSSKYGLLLVTGARAYHIPTEVRNPEELRQTISKALVKGDLK